MSAAAALVAVVAFAVSAAAALVAMASAAASLAVAAAVAAAHAVNEALHLVVGGFARGDNLAFKVERLACERVVEVDSHFVVAHLDDESLKTVAVGIDKRDDVARVDIVFVEAAVHAEYVAVELYDMLVDVGAVGFVDGEGEIERLAFGQGGHALLKRFEGDAHACDKLEGMFLRGPLHQLVDAFGVVGVEVVCHCDVLVL